MSHLNLIERPYALFFLLIVIPSFILAFLRYRQLRLFISAQDETKRGRKARKSFWLTFIFRTFAWIFLVLSFAGISIGEKTVPVQKSSDAVALVFDISYSMTARDSIGGLSRLKAEQAYASRLVDLMEGVSVSVVFAKGSGFLAVPLTEDRMTLNDSIARLSPDLMTSAGSSIGSGIKCALASFPAASSQAERIWVFTDGDETDSSLAEALEAAARYSIPVTLIGFGGSNPVEITAGDGKTKVSTRLQAEKLIDAAARANKKKLISFNGSFSSDDFVSYIAADSESSAYTLLKQLKKNQQEGMTIAYETRPVPRHTLFAILAAACALVSVFLGEFSTSNARFRKIARKSAGLLVFTLILNSCSNKNTEKMEVLAGSWAFSQGKNQEATANFLRAYNSSLGRGDLDFQAFASFDLAATYISQEEYDAALSRLEKVPENSPSRLLSAARYNRGVIFARRGKYSLAAEEFKKAVLADGSNVDARLNLEFCLRQQEKIPAKEGEREMSAVSEEKDTKSLEEAVFNLIKEEEGKQWQKLDSGKRDEAVIDY